MRRLLLDANVLFTAAHNPTGKSALLIELAGEEWLEAITCQLAIEETERNLAALFPEALPRLAQQARSIQGRPTIGDGPCPIPLPPKDVPILLSAIGARSTHLRTGDRRHFGPFLNRPQKTAGIAIQAVSDFLKEL